MSALTRVARLAGILRITCAIGMVALPALVLIEFWTSDVTGFLGVRAGITTIDAIPLPARILALVVAMIPIGLGVYGLYWLQRLFALYRAGTVFAVANSRCLKMFAWTQIISGLLQPVIGAALSVIISWHNPPGQRMLAITLDSNMLGTLLFGLLILVIAWVMGEASRVADENAQFV
ncbi:MAG: DUF2975 domain-containing protein [Pseudomonadota bacterium]